MPAFLPDIGLPSPWSAEEIASLSDPSYGSELLASVDEPGEAGFRNLLILLRNAGVTIIDADQGNRVVVESAEATHIMSLQAGQVSALARERPEHRLVSLNGLIAVLAAALPVEASFADPETRIRAYLSDTLALAATPDELVWRAVVTAPDAGGSDSSDLTEDASPEAAQPTGTTASAGSLHDALQTGQDHPLSLVQTALLLARLRADILVYAVWVRDQTNQAFSTAQIADVEGSLLHSSNSMPEGVAEFPSAQFMQAGVRPCLLDPPPPPPGGQQAADMVKDTLRRTMRNLLGDANPGVNAVNRLNDAANIMEIASTIITSMVAWFHFQVDVSTEPPAERTKETEKDDYPFEVRAEFTADDSSDHWTNCVRLILASHVMTSKGSVVPAAGPWKGMLVDAYLEDTKIMHWTGGVPDPAHMAARTNPSGVATFKAIGTRQPIPLGSNPSPVVKYVPVTFSIDPDSAKAAFEGFFNALKDSWSLALGGRGRTGPVKIAVKKAVQVFGMLGEYGLWQRTGKVPVRDWTIGYPSKIVGILDGTEYGPLHWKVYLEASRIGPCESILESCEYRLDMLDGTVTGKSGTLALDPVRTDKRYQGRTFMLQVTAAPDPENPQGPRVVGHWSFELHLIADYKSAGELWAFVGIPSGGADCSDPLEFSVPMGALSAKWSVAVPCGRETFGYYNGFLRGTLLLQFMYE